jgi:hypothetical protein
MCLSHTAVQRHQQGCNGRLKGWSSWTSSSCSAFIHQDDCPVVMSSAGLFATQDFRIPANARFIPCGWVSECLMTPGGREYVQWVATAYDLVSSGMQVSSWLTRDTLPLINQRYIATNPEPWGIRTSTCPQLNADVVVSRSCWKASSALFRAAWTQACAQDGSVKQAALPLVTQAGQTPLTLPRPNAALRSPRDALA